LTQNPTLRYACDVHHTELRVTFDGTFYGDALAHHLTRRDVERVLRWPHWVDDLTAGAEFPVPETITAWVAHPPVASPRDPSSILVVARERNAERRIHDAWRIYHSDVDLSRARSGVDVLTLFLARFGVDAQIGDATRRLFLPSRIPMGRASNSSMQFGGAAVAADIRSLEIVRLVPERLEIEVTAAFAIDERALRGVLARHERTN
jgi:hypothetical protein